MEKSGQSQSGGPFPDLIEVRVCDTCGDVGLEYCLVVCSKCADGAEHTYCMGDLAGVAEGDWTCQECKPRPGTNKLVQDQVEEATNRSRRQSENSVTPKSCKSSKLKLRSSYSGESETKTSDIPAKRCPVPSETQFIKQARAAVTCDVPHIPSEPNNDSPHHQDFSCKKFRKVKLKSVNEIVFSASQNSRNPQEKAKVHNGCGDKKNAGTLEAELGEKGRTLETGIQSPNASSPRNYSLRTRARPFKTKGNYSLRSRVHASSDMQSSYGKEKAKPPYCLSDESLKLGSQMEIAQEKCSLFETRSSEASNLKSKGQVARNGCLQKQIVKKNPAVHDDRKGNDHRTVASSMPFNSVISGKSIATRSPALLANTHESQQTEYPTKAATTMAINEVCARLALDGRFPFKDLSQIEATILSWNSVKPKIDYTWQGKFLIHSSEGIEHPWNGIQAHLSTSASPKVLEVVDMLPEIIVLEELTRVKMWPSQFMECQVTEENIALYFFAKDPHSYRTYYSRLVDYITKNDLALKGILDGVELLIFPSNVLPEKFQYWNGMLFLWGVFRGRREKNSANTQLENGDTVKSGARDRNAHPEDRHDRARVDEIPESERPSGDRVLLARDSSNGKGGKEKKDVGIVIDLDLSLGPEAATPEDGRQPSTALTLAPPFQPDPFLPDPLELHVARALIHLSRGG